MINIIANGSLGGNIKNNATCIRKNLGCLNFKLTFTTHPVWASAISIFLHKLKLWWTLEQVCCPLFSNVRLFLFLSLWPCPCLIFVKNRQLQETKITVWITASNSAGTACTVRVCCLILSLLCSVWNTQTNNTNQSQPWCVEQPTCFHCLVMTSCNDIRG